MVDQQQHVIHPNVGGPTHADSPYLRKLRDIQRQLELVLAVAPQEDRANLLLISGMIKDIENGR